MLFFLVFANPISVLLTIHFTITFYFYLKAGLLRPGPVPPNSAPATQRPLKPTMMPQGIQPAQAAQSAMPGAPEMLKMIPGSLGYEEDPCVICHEDMNASNDIVTLECGHRYHSPVRITLLVFRYIVHTVKTGNQVTCDVALFRVDRAPSIQSSCNIHQPNR